MARAVQIKGGVDVEGNYNVDSACPKQKLGLRVSSMFFFSKTQQTMTEVWQHPQAASSGAPLVAESAPGADNVDDDAPLSALEQAAAVRRDLAPLAAVARDMVPPVRVHRLLWVHRGLDRAGGSRLLWGHRGLARAGGSR